jgi:hypothetical protein
MAIKSWAAGLDCVDSRKSIVLKDRGSPSTYKALNPNMLSVAQYQIDGKVITQGARCDKALHVEINKCVIFVELKGSNLLKAVDQITQTIQKLKKDLPGQVVKGRIVTTRTPSPDLRSSTYMKLDRVLRSLGGQLLTKTREFTETI